MNRFNDWLGLKITGVVATMWAAYLFALLALISLPAALKSHNVVIIVGWIAQTFLQLVLLSIILVGQRLQDKKSAQRHKDLHQHINNHMNELHKRLRAKEK